MDRSNTFRVSFYLPIADADRPNVDAVVRTCIYSLNVRMQYRSTSKKWNMLYDPPDGEKMLDLRQRNGIQKVRVHGILRYEARLG